MQTTTLRFIRVKFQNTLEMNRELRRKLNDFYDEMSVEGEISTPRVVGMSSDQDEVIVLAEIVSR